MRPRYGIYREYLLLGHYRIPAARRRCCITPKLTEAPLCVHHRSHKTRNENMIARTALSVFAVFICQVLATSCWSETEPRSLTFGAYPGAQDIVLFAIASQHLDRKYGIDLQVKHFQSVPALNSAVVAGAVEAGFASLTNMASARAQGRDVEIFDALLGSSEVVLVLKDSAATNMADLKGQKFGSFSGATSTAFAVLTTSTKAAGEEQDLASAVSVVNAPDAALLGLLENGQLKGALISSGGTVPALLTGKYKVLVNIGEQYRKFFGAPPGQVMVTTTEKYAKDHGEILRSFSATLADGMHHILETPSVWQEYAESIKITNPDAPALYRKLLGEAFIRQWNESTIQVQTRFLTQMIDVIGKSNFLERAPDGLFTTAYASTGK
jgi:ABC-type nitrate/sulfonate/bicarbonate transport system substrate-binding protein